MEQPLISNNILRFIAYGSSDSTTTGNDFIIMKSDLHGVMLSANDGELTLHVGNALYKIMHSSPSRLYDIYSDILIALKYENYNNNNLDISGCSISIE